MAQGITGMIGGFFGSDEELYGKKPIVPEFPSFRRALSETLSADIALIPKIEDLATKSTELYRNLLNKATPGATDLMDLGTANINSMLRGELPKDVEEKIRQYGAEANVASGAGAGSQFGSYRTARDLGLTSLSLTQQGLGAAERWLAQAKGNTFDFSRMFMGPQEAIRQAEGRFSRDWLAAQVEAAPDPAARGAFDSEMAFLGMVLSAYGGGAGYTGKYQQNYGGGQFGGSYGTEMGERQAAAGASYFSSPNYNTGSSYQGDINVYPNVEALA